MAIRVTIATNSDGDIPAAFDAVNLFEFYRSMSELRRKLRALEEDQDSPARVSRWPA